jgi:hypothetical protein
MKYNLILLHHEQTKGMKSFGTKALLKIKLQNKTDTIIHHQLEQIGTNLDKDSKIVIVVGFDKERLIKKLDISKKYKNIIIVDNTEYKKLNQSYAMMLGLQKIDNNLPTLIIDSGVLLQKPFIMTKDAGLDNNIIFTNKSTKEFDVGCTVNNCNVEYMFYDLNPKWINMFSICPKYKNIIQNISKLHKNSNIFEIINYSLKECNTKFISIDSKVYYIKNQKHKLVK